MRKIFISYRRTDAFPAGSLGRDLRERFGEEQVFRDREDIDAGASWRQRVLDEIDHDSVLLVLIGNNWVGADPSRPQPRLFDESDPVRLEVHDGLKDGAKLIPILLEETKMPGPREVPPELAPMCEANALRLRDGDWQHDFERLCTALERAGLAPKKRERASSVSRPVSWKTGVAGFLAIFSLFGFSDFDSDSQAFVVTFSVLAAALAAWAASDVRRGLVSGKWVNFATLGFCALLFLAAIGTEVEPTAETLAEPGAGEAIEDSDVAHEALDEGAPELGPSSEADSHANAPAAP